MIDYQPKYDPERSKQVAAAISTKNYPILQWPSLRKEAEVLHYYKGLQSVEQEQIEKAFGHIFHHIFFAERYRVDLDRYHQMLEARLGLKDGRVHRLLEVADEFYFSHPAEARDVQDDLIKKLRFYHVVDSVKELVTIK